MTVSKSNLTRAAIALESTFGTLKTTGFAYIPIVSSSGTDKFDDIAETTKTASGTTAQTPLRGKRNVEHTTNLNMDYNTLNDIFKIVTGSAATGTPPVYSFVPAAEIGTYFASLVEDLQVSIPSLAGGLIEQMTIKSTAGEKATMELLWRFQSRTLGTFPTISTALTKTPILHSHLVFRIGDISDALASTDSMRVKDITFTTKLNMQIDFASESDLIVQPILDGNTRETTLDITGLYYDSSDEIAAIMSASENNTQLQADLIWSNTGSLGEKLEIDLPELFLTEKVSLGIPESGLHPFTAKFKAYENKHNTTNMATVTKDYLIKSTHTAP